MRTAEEYLESLRGKVWLIPKNFVEVFEKNLKIIPKFYPIARQVAKCWARVDLAQLCVPQFPVRLDLFHVTHR